MLIVQHCAENCGRIHQLKVCVRTPKECVTCPSWNGKLLTLLPTLRRVRCLSHVKHQLPYKVHTWMDLWKIRANRKHSPVDRWHARDGLAFRTFVTSSDLGKCFFCDIVGPREMFFFISSVTHNIPYSWVPGNPGNENGRFRIPGNEKTHPGMETVQWEHKGSRSYSYIRHKKTN